MRRKGSLKSEVPPLIDAIGLVQGRMIEMVVAADIAEKAVGVTVEDIRGSCPQNIHKKSRIPQRPETDAG